MGSFSCSCGHCTKDSEETKKLYSKVYNLDEEEVIEKEIGRTISNFFEAIIKNNDEEWLQNKLGKNYPIDEELKEKISDLLLSITIDKGTTLFKCPKCERIHLLEKENTWHSYKPDGKCGT